MKNLNLKSYMYGSFTEWIRDLRKANKDLTNEVNGFHDELDQEIEKCKKALESYTNKA